MSERIESELAKRIAADLFTDGAGRHARRLVMEFDERKIDGTGWSERGIVDRIERALHALRPSDGGEGQPK